MSIVAFKQKPISNLNHKNSVDEPFSCVDGILDKTPNPEAQAKFDKLCVAAQKLTKYGVKVYVYQPIEAHCLNAHVYLDIPSLFVFIGGALEAYKEVSDLADDVICVSKDDGLKMTVTVFDVWKEGNSEKTQENS